MATPAPFPFDVPVVQLDQRGNPQAGWPMSKDMAIYFQTSVIQPIGNTPQFFPVVSLTGQNASIATTPIPLPTLATGAYRVNYFAEITTAAVTSSSLTVAVSFTHNTKTLTFTGAAVTGNTTTSIQTNTWDFLIDASSPISYSTTYASNGAGEMKYTLWIRLEAM